MKKKKNEFKTIPVKFEDQRNVYHHLFVKQHLVREKSNDRPSELTLFVCNIPPYCTEESLKSVFKQCGSVKSVHFANVEKPSVINSYGRNPFGCFEENEIQGYKLAYVVFSSAKSLQKALTSEWKDSDSLTIDKDTLNTGLTKWCREYSRNFPNMEVMQQEIDHYMATYDEKEEEKITEEKKATEADEEGWISVTKRGRNPGFARKQSVKNNIIKTINRKKRRKTLLNFYNFQIKESKINHLTELRKKFEEDKKKVQALKSQRKFKPF